GATRSPRMSVRSPAEPHTFRRTCGEQKVMSDSIRHSMYLRQNTLESFTSCKIGRLSDCKLNSWLGKSTQRRQLFLNPSIGRGIIGTVCGEPLHQLPAILRRDRFQPADKDTHLLVRRRLNF